MSIINLSLAAVRTRRLPQWSEIRTVFIEWRERVHSRCELMALTDRELWGMGLTRSDAENEFDKPFWRR